MNVKEAQKPCKSARFWRMKENYDIQNRLQPAPIQQVVTACPPWRQGRRRCSPDNKASVAWPWSVVSGVNVTNKSLEKCVSLTEPHRADLLTVSKRAPMAAVHSARPRALRAAQIRGGLCCANYSPWGSSSLGSVQSVFKEYSLVSLLRKKCRLQQVKSWVKKQAVQQFC